MTKYKLVLVLSILSVVLDSNSAQKLNYTIAVVFEVNTGYAFDRPKMGPAIELGIVAMKRILGDTLHLNIVEKNMPQGSRECTANKYGSTAASLYFKKGTNGFIGPGCSVACEVVGRMTADWNLPLISPVATANYLANKKDLKTLTRMSYNLVKFTEFYIAVCSYFNWTDISVIHDGHYASRIFADQVEAAFGENATIVKLNPDGKDRTIQSALIKASRHSRVIFVKVGGDTFRQLMIVAHTLGMTSGDYAFVFLGLFEEAPGGKLTWKRNDGLDEIAKKACESVLMTQCRTPNNSLFREFEREVKMRSQRDYNYTWGDVPVNLFVTAAHDSFVLYATALAETISAGEDPFDGRNVIRRLWGRMIEGITGKIAIDIHGDRDVDFSLTDYTDPEQPVFQEVGYYLGSEKQFKLVSGVSIHWPNNHGPPKNKPRCGFTGNAPECKSYKLIVSLSSYILLLHDISFVVLLDFIIDSVKHIYTSFRKLRLEYDLQSLWWKIKWEDITIHTAINSIFQSKFSCGTSYQSDNRSRRTQAFNNVAMYKGTTVALRNINITNLHITRETLLELKQMRDINCTNLTKFQGICTDEDKICIVNEYCSRGSLQDILQNDSIKLDKDFKVSLINDIVKAMLYIHGSPIWIHGRLNSSNAVIDSRFVLKITDFGLRSIRTQESKPENEYKKNLLWIAPEHLRTNPTKDFSQLGDVFSFGIILYEMMSRSDPYGSYGNFTLDDIISNIRNSTTNIMRPDITRLVDDHDITKLMTACWSETVNERPDFPHIRRKLKEGKWGESGGNVLDKLMVRMEHYANNLESLVEERTQAFLDEKRKSEELLYNILPISIAEKLKNGDTVNPEAYTSVTVYFSDIVGFTNISAESTPIQVVDLLNDLYTCFDTIIENYDVYKVETIGDAYMVVSGLPKRNEQEHARQIARMSLSILSSVRLFKIRHRPDDHLQARIGLHTGPVCAGVVGRKMPRYCLFGDTVNTASRMESNGQAMKIHISSTTKEVLETFKGFQLVSRGEMEIKGKGIMTTYWLEGDDA
ncbi:hypothetical protein ScPMuIL_002868 [Solemya velum]